MKRTTVSFAAGVVASDSKGRLSTIELAINQADQRLTQLQNLVLRARAGDRPDLRGAPKDVDGFVVLACDPSRVRFGFDHVEPAQHRAALIVASKPGRSSATTQIAAPGTRWK